MKILVINASPHKAKSTTLRLTNAFLEGMGETAEVVDTVDLNIGPCRACYACWVKTEGKCILKDDAPAVLDKIRAAELVIWSIPLYCYSAPSHCKALMDRTLCFNRPEMYIGSDGRAHHYGYEDGSKRAVLIASGSLPDIAGNFDGLVFQLRHMFGENTAAVLCAEGALFLSKKTEALTQPYLETVKKAGAEYKCGGRISEETQAFLDRPILPREDYIRDTNDLYTLMREL